MTENKFKGGNCMNKKIRYSVLGAGNGGIAIAGYIAMKGYEVNLYNRTEENIISLIKNPIIHLTGEIEGCGRLNKVTDNIREAIENTDIIMVTVPAVGHKFISQNIAPYLEDEQIIILNPGRTGGALEVYENIRNSECTAQDVVVAEAQSLIYACRITGNNEVHIFKSKKEVSLSAIPASRTEEVISKISPIFSQFIPAKDVMETSLNNFGAIFHPAPTLLNSGHIERGITFDYYTEGITPSVGRFIERMDKERMEIADKLNIDTMSAKDWLYETYGSKGDTLYDAVQNNPAYKGLKSPKGLNIRYIYEDVPCSLVPMSSLAKQLDIETPAIDSIIVLSEIITGKNFWEEGRTVKKLGLEGLDKFQIHHLARTGKLLDNKEGVVA